MALQNLWHQRLLTRHPSPRQRTSGNAPVPSITKLFQYNQFAASDVSYIYTYIHLFLKNETFFLQAYWSSNLFMVRLPHLSVLR